MKAWHFSENAYPYLPPAETYPSIRVTLPNRVYDPEKGAALPRDIVRVGPSRQLPVWQASRTTALADQWRWAGTEIPAAL